MFSFIIRFIVIGICSILFGITFNSFLIPHHLLSGGVTGIAIIINHYIPINTGWIILFLNLPIFTLAFIYLGKKFAFSTIYAVAILSLTMRYFPVDAVSHDILLSSVFGGVIYGASIGLLIRFGGSTGGTDIICIILSKKKDIQVGYLNTWINMCIVGSSGLVFGWDKALYTIIAIYVSGRTIDMIYTNQHKLTLTIVTDKYEELCDALLHLHSRGITVSEAIGGFSHQPKQVLTTIITRYELAETKQTIKSIDPKAFVNITKTIEVMGRFRKN